jgi:H+-transporting ATPase
MGLQLLTERRSEQVSGVLSCFDRILIQGTLPGLCYAEGMTGYLYAHQVRIFDYTQWAQPRREALRENAERLASENGLKIDFIRRPKSFRKEDRIHQVLKERGEHPGRVCPPERLRNDPNRAVEECNLFAGVLPEDKFRLVQALQQHGHTVGMTGDGVNDAPALKQAEVGIAVANATDVAKAAASVVLTKPGLTDIVAAVKVSRRIYQRMLTYTLNKIIKTIEIALFLSLGLMLTHTFVVTPLLIVLLLFTNDFVTMSIASDRVSFSSKPDHWDIQALILTALPLAGLMVLLSFGIFLAAKDLLHIPLGQLQTLMFAMLVFSGQGTVYLVQERRHFWHSAPGKWLLLSSLGDIAVVSLFASQGILMTPVRLPWVAAVLGVISGYLVGVDFLKIRIFQHFGLHQTGS